MRDLSFYLFWALFLTHELDAIRRHEWRIFPILRTWHNDELAYRWFTLLHIPLFILILWLNAHPTESVKLGFQLTLAAFGLVHAGLHRLLAAHPANEFNNPLSQGIIDATALSGLLFLILVVSGV